MKSINLKIMLIIMVAVFTMIFPAIASAQIAGIRINDSVSHVNDLAVGRVNLDNSEVVLTNGLDLRSGQIALIGDIDVASLFAHVRIMGYSVDSYALSIAGQIDNNSENDAILNFYIETGKEGLERGERRFVGTILVRAGDEKEIAPSSFFQRKLWEQLAIIATEEDDEKVALYVQVVSKGDGGAKIHIERMVLRSAPIYHNSYLIHNNPHNTYPSHANVTDARLIGAVENRGENDMRVVLVAGMEDMFGMNYTEGVIVDAVVAPGETISAKEMILYGALPRLKDAMSEAAFGMPIEIHMFIFSKDGIQARVQNLEVKTEVSYR